MITKLLEKKSVNIVFWLAVTAASVIVLRVLDMTNKQTVVFLIIALLAILIHLMRYNKNPDYLANDVLCLGKQSGRSSQYDYLRLIAASFVIITHSVQIDILLENIGQDSMYFYCCAFMLTLSCNLIYVMLSGALLLPYRDESLGHFYLHRMPKVLIPLIVYYIWYVWQNKEFGTLGIGEIVLRIVGGTMDESPHYWLIYTILSLYIAFPFMRYMLKELPYRWLTALVVLSLVFMGITQFSPITVGISTFFSGWIGVAIMGYWVTREETKKAYPILIGIGLISAVIICLLVVLREDYKTVATNCSPFMALFSVGIFALIFKAGVFAKGNYLLRLLSKYSYAIILVHWWAINFVTLGHFGIGSNTCGPLGIIISLAFTLLVCLGAAFIVDNLVVVVVSYAWDRLVGFFGFKN